MCTSIYSNLHYFTVTSMYHAAMQQLLPHVIRMCSNRKGSRKKGPGLRVLKTATPGSNLARFH